MNSKEWRYLDGQAVPLPLSQMGLSTDFGRELKNIWGVNAKTRSLLGPVMVATIAGELKLVSAGSDSTVWGVNSKDEIFRWTGSSFAPVPNGTFNRFRLGTRSGSENPRVSDSGSLVHRLSNCSVMKRIAASIIGGGVTSAILELPIYPVIFVILAAAFVAEGHTR